MASSLLDLVRLLALGFMLEVCEVEPWDNEDSVFCSLEFSGPNSSPYKPSKSSAEPPYLSLSLMLFLFIFFVSDGLGLIERDRLPPDLEWACLDFRAPSLTPPRLPLGPLRLIWTSSEAREDATGTELKPKPTELELSWDNGMKVSDDRNSTGLLGDGVLDAPTPSPPLTLLTEDRFVFTGWLLVGSRCCTVEADGETERSFCLCSISAHFSWSARNSCSLNWSLVNKLSRSLSTIFSLALFSDVICCWMRLSCSSFLRSCSSFLWSCSSFLRSSATYLSFSLRRTFTSPSLAKFFSCNCFILSSRFFTLLVVAVAALVGLVEVAVFTFPLFGAIGSLRFLSRDVISELLVTPLPRSKLFVDGMEWNAGMERDTGMVAVSGIQTDGLEDDPSSIFSVCVSSNCTNAAVPRRSSSSTSCSSSHFLSLVTNSPLGFGQPKRSSEGGGDLSRFLGDLELAPEEVAPCNQLGPSPAEFCLCYRINTRDTWPIATYASKQLLLTVRNGGKLFPGGLTGTDRLIAPLGAE